MKPVVLDSRAAAEVEEGIAFYEGRQPGLGDEFRDAIEAAVGTIGRMPRAFSPYLGGYRKYVVPRFPYVIFYREYDDRVWVAAVHNARRQPDTWMDREPG